jgi:hypothetical protein
MSVSMSLNLIVFETLLYLEIFNRIVQGFVGSLCSVCQIVLCRVILTLSAKLHALMQCIFRPYMTPQNICSFRQNSERSPRDSCGTITLNLLGCCECNTLKIRRLMR